MFSTSAGTLQIRQRLFWKRKRNKYLLFWDTLSLAPQKGLKQSDLEYFENKLKISDTQISGNTFCFGQKPA
jgi:hypothetical protein